MLHYYYYHLSDYANYQSFTSLTVAWPSASGDQVSRRGALTGGYYDTRKSRLELQKSKMEIVQQLQQEELEYSGHKAKLQNILYEITNANDWYKWENWKWQSYYVYCRVEVSLWCCWINYLSESSSVFLLLRSRWKSSAKITVDVMTTHCPSGC